MQIRCGRRKEGDIAYTAVGVNDEAEGERKLLKSREKIGT